METEASYSELDGLLQHWLAFQQPIYVVHQDLVNITMPNNECISWSINESIVMVGCRIDGWPIEIIDGNLKSVEYDAVTRYFSEDDA